MRIAVVGSGIAGMASAWLLSRRHDVVLFEADDRLGGHTDTHALDIDGKPIAVDTGFIVFNDVHYPLLSRMFAEIGVESQPSTMSFSVHDARSGLQYNAGNLRGLFCQPGNLVNQHFLGMLRDLRRFHREAPALLDSVDPGPSLCDYLASNRYGVAFREWHIVPMASALWSSPSARIADFPARQLVRFMANHHMLQIAGRPTWRVVRGGSSRYIAALQQHWSVQCRLATPVLRVFRRARGDGIDIISASGRERFDHVVLACHADDALALIEQPADGERAVLGAITFQDNDTVLHTDARLLPPNRRAWAAWNAHVPAQADAPCTVSYWMNVLQSLRTRDPLIVTLNRSAEIDPSRILRRRRYRHPLQDAKGCQAKRRFADIQGVDRLWFAGAYWHDAFHEDGMRSAVEVARGFGVAW